MFGKKSQKKIQEEIKQEMEVSKNSISQIVDDYQEYEIDHAEEIGNKVDFNYARVYIYMLSSYGEDIITLVNNERYSSLYPLLDNFLKCYGLGKNLIKSYFQDKNTYEKMIRRYYASTLHQRKTECIDFDPDLAINYEDEVKFYDIRLEQMEKVIREFFSDYADEIDEENKDVAVYEIIGKIYEETNQPLDIERKVIEALKTNEEFSTEGYKKAIKLYISAKSASTNNIQTVLTRSLGLMEGMPALLINKNEGIAPQVLDIVEKCLRDITGIVMNGFSF